MHNPKTIDKPEACLNQVPWDGPNYTELLIALAFNRPINTSQNVWMRSWHDTDKPHSQTDRNLSPSTSEGSAISTSILAVPELATPPFDPGYGDNRISNIQQINDIAAIERKGTSKSNIFPDFDRDTEAEGMATVVGGTTTSGSYVADAGHHVQNADGTYTFRPSAGFFGNVVVTYKICENPDSIPAKEHDISNLKAERKNRLTETPNDHQGAVILPVESKTLEGKISELSVQLYWISASEKNFSHYEVEKSEDGQSYRMIHAVAGKGHLNRVRHYHYMDMKASANSSYRIKMINLDGQFEYSDLITVNAEG